ncbi:hypothetical protein ACHAXN_007111 [Cyclotella atomus]
MLITNSEHITILGFGSLLSPASARLTFPTLQNFRLGRVPNHRRIFSHPASIFFQRKIANFETLEMSSLSVEECDGHSFVCSVFEVPNDGLSDTATEERKGWIPSRAFLEREEEFDIVMVPYDEFGTGSDQVPSRTSTSVSDSSDQPMGVICRRFTDEAYVSRWGQQHFDKQYTQYGIDTIWNWGEESGLKPCSVYLRHCVLASQSCGKECHDSFLDETYLVDRKTTIREYLKMNPEVMKTEPPPELKHRYGG